MNDRMIPDTELTEERWDRLNEAAHLANRAVEHWDDKQYPQAAQLFHQAFLGFNHPDLIEVLANEIS